MTGGVLLEQTTEHDALERDCNGAVILDRKTGRPKLKDEWAGPGVIHSYMTPEVDVGVLNGLPEHISANLEKARERPAAFQPRGSVQSWEETIYAPLADGTAVTGSAETIMLPIFTLPANYFYPGRLVKWTVMGRQSTAITTPGTITLRLSYSASGVGAVTVAASGAFAPDSTAAATNLTFMVEWWMHCRSVGTAGTAMGWGRVEWTDYDDASAAALVANLAMRMAPTSAPATATIDTTVARALSPSYQSSVTTGSMTAHTGYLEALT